MVHDGRGDGLTSGLTGGALVNFVDQLKLVFAFLSLVNERSDLEGRRVIGNMRKGNVAKRDGAG